MSRENKSRYAVLGMLSLRPMSGYDIKKTIESSLSNFWNESYGQIYPILRSLEHEGLVVPSEESDNEQGGRPHRTYALTEAGRAELHRWLAKPVEYEVGRSEILLKLFFGWQTSPEENVRHVEQFRAEQIRLLHEYAGIAQWLQLAQADEPGLPYWLMTVSYGQHITRALTAWCDETLAALQAIQNPKKSAIQNPKSKIQNLKSRRLEQEIPP